MQINNKDDEYLDFDEEVEEKVGEQSAKAENVKAGYVKLVIDFLINMKKF